MSKIHVWQGIEDTMVVYNKFIFLDIQNEIFTLGWVRLNCINGSPKVISHVIFFRILSPAEGSI